MSDPTPPSAPEAAAGVLVVRRVRGRRRVAVLVRGPRWSLPKALLAGGESFEDAAKRAAAGFLRGQVTLGESVGVALADAGDRSLAVWFYRARWRTDSSGTHPHPSPPSLPLNPSDPLPTTEDWRLTWVTPTRATRELAQREERLLVERVLAHSRFGPAAWMRAIGELIPRQRRERWTFLALTCSALAAALAATLGWLAPVPWNITLLPRAILAAALGGFTSAALRGERRHPPLLGAAAGAVTGTIAATVLGGGLIPGIAFSASATLALAWFAGWLERVVLVPRSRRS